VTDADAGALPDQPSDEPGPPEPSSLARRRLLIALGFGAANAALLRRLPALGTGRSTATGPQSSPSTVAPATTTSTAPATTTPSVTEAPAAAPVYDPEALVDPAGHVFDLVITGGRVVDPATGYDAVAQVGIDGDTVTYIGDQPLTGSSSLAADGLVVAPGFIDILSYPPDGYGEWFKVADGVTSNLCLHGIDAPTTSFLQNVAFHDPPVNYGGATDQSTHRQREGIGIDPATADEIALLAELADTDILDGALGIHEQPEYVPGVTLDEMLAHGEVAARHGVPLCLHLRSGRPTDLAAQAAAVDEALTVARRTGCAVHIEHLNSTGGTGRMTDAIAQIDAARAEGMAITACAYPYTYWATYAGTPRFDDFEAKFGITHADLQVAGTDRRVDPDDWDRIRAENPLTAAFAMSEADVEGMLTVPWTLIGSDGLIGESHNNHPRGAGCFSRVLGVYVRERGVLSLSDALAKMTILPARLLEPASPAMARRGRLQGGAAADITVFDAARISDRADIVEPGRESVGVHHVVVGGRVVRRDQVSDRSVRPGIPLLSEVS